MIDTKEIMERLKIVLDAKTQNEIAHYFQVSKKTVSEWKNGNTAIPYQRLLTLAENRGVSLNWLFYGVGSRTIESSTVNGVLNKQIGDNNSFYIQLDKPASADEKEELKTIASYLNYAPPAYIEQVLEKLKQFKTQVETN